VGHAHPVMFGVGQYLYGCDAPWVDVDEHRQIKSYEIAKLRDVLRIMANAVEPITEKPAEPQTTERKAAPRTTAHNSVASEPERKRAPGKPSPNVEETSTTTSSEPKPADPPPRKMTTSVRAIAASMDGRSSMVKLAGPIIDDPIPDGDQIKFAITREGSAAV
jgi:hypothetical protein